MTTQRDRLAAVLTEAAAYVSPATHGRPERIEHELWLAGAIASIDALLARGVRVIPPGYWQVDGDLTPEDIAIVKKVVEEADGRNLIVVGRYTLRWHDLGVMPEERVKP